MPTGPRAIWSPSYAILRDCESMNAVWGKPDMGLLQA
jgi:hypothetical protein